MARLEVIAQNVQGFRKFPCAQAWLLTGHGRVAGGYRAKCSKLRPLACPMRRRICKLREDFGPSALKKQAAEISVCSVYAHEICKAFVFGMDTAQIRNATARLN